MAREFEAAADELIVQAVQQSLEAERASSTKPLEATSSTTPKPSEEMTKDSKKTDVMDESED